mmetsp:Transcript_10582/g.65100  ORF Transcript_10582/g.65100 Transcript_10582/m.65100 type:complete len:488 (-) Transcript_10582:1068-2531(-)
MRPLPNNMGSRRSRRFSFCIGSLLMILGVVLLVNVHFLDKMQAWWTVAVDDGQAKGGKPEVNDKVSQLSQEGRKLLEIWNQVDVPVRWKGPMPSKSQLLEALALVASLPPPHPINQSCTPPALDPHPTCTGGTGFTGTALPAPRRIIHMVLLGFETDTLEILLREELDVVDVIFLVESTRSHNPRGQDPRAAKPLMWDRLKHSPRFQFVPADKVVHIVIDDSEIFSALGEPKDEIFAVESLQTKMGVAHVKYWAQQSGGLGENDLLISGNVDELLSRSTIQKLRWCEIADPVISSAVWMPLGTLDRVFRTDWPAAGLQYTFALPTIYKWNGILTGTFNGERKFSLRGVRQSKGRYVQGGLHMTNIGFLPHALLKELTGTEYKGEVLLDNHTLEMLDRAQLEISGLTKNGFLKRRTFSLDSLDGRYHGWMLYAPWFLACNQKRYPYWYSKPDLRNQALLYVLKMLASNKHYDSVQFLAESELFHDGQL